MEIIFGEGGLMLARWVHFLAGVVWIGLLYYFNFVQGPFFAEADAQTKNVAIAKLVPRALWWFRWGAMFTFLSGLFIIMGRGHIAGAEIYSTSWGVNILTGALFATIMFLNVWLVIWPNQKVVIQSATQVLGGGQALPNAASCAAKAGLASRTNTLLSIPMLLLMGMASHLGHSIDPAKSLAPYWIAIFILALLIEGNALKGKQGPMTTVKGVITCGFVLTAIVYALGCFLL